MCLVNIYMVICILIKKLIKWIKIRWLNKINVILKKNDMYPKFFLNYDTIFHTFWVLKDYLKNLSMRKVVWYNWKYFNEWELDLKKIFFNSTNIFYKKIFILQIEVGIWFQRPLFCVLCALMQFN